MTAINIAGKPVGEGQPCFVIAEAGVNHNGDIETAIKLINEAAIAGVDAVKFQTFKAAAMTTAQAPKADYQKISTLGGESQREMLERLELSREAHIALIKHCRKMGVLFISSPFDNESVELLAELEIPVFKVPSGEITNLPLLERLAAKGKPMIVSSGMASMEELEEAINTITSSGPAAMILLHCVSNYPAAPADINLRAMDTIRTSFGLPVGYSDHTLGTAVALAAVALGACVIEKHFTLDRKMAGPDHKASIEPGEMAELVKAIRTIESALGQPIKQPRPSETATAAIARKSLVAASDIPAGATLTEDLIAIKRPGTGIPPAMISALVGRKIKVALSSGELLSHEMLL